MTPHTSRVALGTGGVSVGPSKKHCRCRFHARPLVELLKRLNQPITLCPSKGNETMSTHTIRLHRVLRSTPEKVYRAFIDADAMCKWLPPNGFTGKMHHLDAKVGGTFKMSFTNFTTGNGHSFGGNYLEMVPHERLRYTDKFDDP